MKKSLGSSTMLSKLTDDLLNGFKISIPIPILNVRLGLLGPDFKRSVNFLSPELNLYSHTHLHFL